MPSKAQRITGWVLTGLVGLFLIGLSAVGKFTDFPDKEVMFKKIGVPMELSYTLGVIEVAVTAIDGSDSNVVHDAAGNMPNVPKRTGSDKYDLKWDAWNRLIEVKDGATVVATYKYDGQHCRISKTAGSRSTTEKYYYNEQWQCLEIRSNTFEANIPGGIHHHAQIARTKIRRRTHCQLRLGLGRVAL